VFRKRAMKISAPCRESRKEVIRGRFEARRQFLALGVPYGLLATVEAPGLSLTGEIGVPRRHVLVHLNVDQPSDTAAKPPCRSDNQRNRAKLRERAAAFVPIVESSAASMISAASSPTMKRSLKFF
jgi:hypothetical protein